MSQEEHDKEVLKEALKEWMDEKFATVGRWTLSALGIYLLGSAVYFILITNGWHRLTH